MAAVDGAGEVVVKEAELEWERLWPQTGGACFESFNCLMGMPLAGGFLSMEEEQDTIVKRNMN